MPAIEELLHAELKRAADAVQPGQLRPLRVPVRPAHRWRPRLLPATAAIAVIAVVAVASVLATTLTGGHRAAPAQATAGMPRHYVTVARSAAGLTAVVRDSADGHVTGSVAVPGTRGASYWGVTAAADHRHFVIVADLSRSGVMGSSEYRFFRMIVSPDGRPGQLGRLPQNLAGGPQLDGMALSPDGAMLALSLYYPGPAKVFRPYNAVEVVNLTTGQVRTWTARGATWYWYWPGALTWGDGHAVLKFTWWHTVTTGPKDHVPYYETRDLVGIRELNTSAPGSNLLASRLTAFPKAAKGLQSAVIVPGGREVIASYCRDASGSGSPQRTGVARIVALSAADGRPLRVLATQTARFANWDAEGTAFDMSCTVWSVDPSGNHVLAQPFRFGRIDHGVFTPLPGRPPGVLFVIAAW
jgi:hypothetical protein